MSRQPIPAHSRAWVEVDLGALRRNGAALAARARVPLLAVIKADGYGLGAVRVAQSLEAIEPWGFGVATVAEGIELRDVGVSRPILILSPVLPDEYVSIRSADILLRRAEARASGPGILHVDRHCRGRPAFDSRRGRHGHGSVVFA